MHFFSILGKKVAHAAASGSKFLGQRRNSDVPKGPKCSNTSIPHVQNQIKKQKTKA